MLDGATDTTDTATPLDGDQRTFGLPLLGLAAGIVLVAILAAMGALHVSRNGEFTYPIDDSYIYLALGENLSQHGNLGINPGEFSSSSSSPLWPLLIAATMAIVGVHVGIPLTLAVLTAIVLLAGLDRWCQQRGFSVTERAIFLGAILIVVPLPLLTLTGMEHVLQCGAAFLLVWTAVRIATAQTRSRWDLWALAGPAALCTATRFEGLFVVFAAVVVLATGRRWKHIAVALAAGAMPPMLVAAVNVSQDWPMIPASIMAKTVALHSGIAKYLPHPDIEHWMYSYRLVAVVGLTAASWWVGRKLMGAQWPQRNNLIVLAALTVTACHFCYATVGWFYRYEAYLIVLNLGAIALCLHSVKYAGKLPSMDRAARIVLAVLALGGCLGGLRVYPKAIAGMQEIYDQQIQMARFAAEACPGCRVAANDIGAVALYGGGTVTDVYGLANHAVLIAKLHGGYDAQALEHIARTEGVSLVMLYPVDIGMVPGIPSDWTRLGTWRSGAAQVVAGEVVEFYSADPARTADLRQSFRKFQPSTGVAVSVDP